MKKIYFLTFLLIFLFSQILYSQIWSCNFIDTTHLPDECPLGWMQTTVEVPATCPDGLTYIFRVTVCYRCDVTHNGICVLIKKYDFPFGNCQVDLFEAVKNWFLYEAGLKYCGIEPCGFKDETPSIIIAQPLCVRIKYVPNNSYAYTMEYSNDCYAVCIHHFTWCYCLCDDKCNDPPCPNEPHVKYERTTLITQPLMPSCLNTDDIKIYMYAPTGQENNPDYYYNLRAKYPWEVCIHINNECIPGGFNGPLLP